MNHVLDRQGKLVFVMLGVAAVLGASVGQDPTRFHLSGIEEGDHLVIEQIGRGDRRLAIVKLGKGDLRAVVDEGLLLDPSYALHVADVDGCAERRSSRGAFRQL